MKKNKKENKNCVYLETKPIPSCNNCDGRNYNCFDFVPEINRIVEKYHFPLATYCNEVNNSNFKK